ncbi:MAG: MFS transporter [Campylobacterales bacterium]|nr:MFS transporter [Campylobacterales bacterium]
MKKYISLLRANAVLRRLSTIQLIAYFGAWFSNVAIYTLLLDMNVSAGIVAFVAMLHFLAGVVQAPLSGSLIDSVKPKKLMLILIVVEIFATLFLILVNGLNDLWLLYILIFLKMAAASFYFTTEMSLLPKILQGDQLQRANELHSIIWSFSYTLGMALSGFFVHYFGITMAFILDATIFVGAFFMLFTLELELEVIKGEENLLQMMRDTFSYLKKNTLALHLMVLHAFVGLTAFDALVALMVDTYYAGIVATALALGLLHSARALGLVIGPVVLSRYLSNQFIVYIFIAQGLAVMLWAYMMHDFYLSLLASVIVGFFTTTLWSYTYTLLQKNIEPKYYGRIVAYNDMLFLSSAAFTSYMIGFLATHNFSLKEVAFIMGVGFLIGGIYFQWVLKVRKIEEISE